jgi:hypothetical protein
VDDLPRLVDDLNFDKIEEVLDLIDGPYRR